MLTVPTTPTLLFTAHGTHLGSHAALGTTPDALSAPNIDRVPPRRPELQSEGRRLEFADVDAPPLTHYLFRFPAKFHPPVVHSLIRAYTKRGETVLDPFCGSGTLLLAAAAEGRHAMGSDIDPLAVFVARVKAHRFRPAHLRSSWTALSRALLAISRPDEEYESRIFLDLSDREYLDSISKDDLRVPQIPNILDHVLMANRESMEESQRYRHVQAVLNEVFNEARQQYEDWLKEERRPDQEVPEHRQEWVSDRLVEYPVADALTRYSLDSRGAEPDDSWMYLQVDRASDIEAVAESLYAKTRKERPYRYRYAARGRAERMVAYDPASGLFTINQDHELVAAYREEPAARGLIENIATGEALLEVYLREADVAPHVVGEVLERRDLLLRELAEAEMFALEALSQYLRDSTSSKMDLEIAVVAGARALGFVTKHISGAGQPDGIARFNDFPHGEQKITLEAKSSRDTPPAKDIDFAALELHVKGHGASGCLLVAPGYQGGPDGNTARSAKSLKISCWTVGQFADVIQAAESRHITARQILDVVHRAFAPDDVSVEVDTLLADPAWEHRALYHAIVQALRDTDEVLTKSSRNTVLLGGEIARMEGFAGVEEEDIRAAVRDLAGASQGAILLREDGTIVLNVDYDELERRVRSLTRDTGTPRRKGAFRKSSEE